MRSSNFAAVLLLAAMSAAGCASHGDPVRLPPTAADPGADFVRVRTATGPRLPVVRVPLEEYVLATVLAEFAPPAGDLAHVVRMIEVQSIISRTYAVAHLNRHAREGFDLCASTHCQLYRPVGSRAVKWAGAATEAVRRTAGMVLRFGSTPVRAFFHADCGGHTSGAAAVWGGRAPLYLVAQPDQGPAAVAHATWEFRADRTRLRQALNADRRTNVGARFDGMQIFERDDAGRAALVVLNGEREPLVRGEELREILSRTFGARSVRSTLFEVRREGETFVFAGRGFGHGVGLCQAGAFARIRAGASPADVLEIYFPGTRLIRRPTGS